MIKKHHAKAQSRKETWRGRSSLACSQTDLTARFADPRGWAFRPARVYPRVSASFAVTFGTLQSIILCGRTKNSFFFLAPLRLGAFA